MVHSVVVVLGILGDRKMRAWYTYILAIHSVHQTEERVKGRPKVLCAWIIYLFTTAVCTCFYVLLKYEGLVLLLFFACAFMHTKRGEGRGKEGGGCALPCVSIFN